MGIGGRKAGIKDSHLVGSRASRSRDARQMQTTFCSNLSKGGLCMPRYLRSRISVHVSKNSRQSSTLKLTTSAQRRLKSLSAFAPAAHLSIFQRPSCLPEPFMLGIPGQELQTHSLASSVTAKNGGDRRRDADADAEEIELEANSRAVDQAEDAEKGSPPRHPPHILTPTACAWDIPLLVFLLLLDVGSNALLISVALFFCR